MMRIVITAIFSMGSFALLAQGVTGTILDKLRKTPIAGATVSTSAGRGSSDDAGRFSVPARFPDTVKIRYIGYDEFRVPVKRAADLIVLLIRGPLILKEVDLSAGKFGYKEDSAGYRKQFDEAFSYKSMTADDVLSKVNPWIQATPQTARGASLISLNVGDLFRYVTRKKSSASRLHIRVLADEVRRYIHANFRREWVAGLVPLRGDSLTTFMEKYRPTRQQISGWTKPELMMYVRASYFSFRKK